MTRTLYRLVFLAGAIWNVLGGVYIVVTTDQIFASAGISPPSPPLYYHSWIALFMVFGIGYFFAFRDLERNRNIILLGAMGKLAFSSIFFYNLAVYRDQTPMSFAIPAVGDLVFAALFLLFLVSFPVEGRGRT